MSLSQDTAVRLLVTHRAMLLGWLRSVVRDSYLAEDLFQEVSIIVVKKCAEIRDAKDFPAWARSVARHKALHALRDRRSSRLVFSDELINLFETHWKARDNTRAVDQIDALNACLGRLSPYARRLIELRHEKKKCGADLAAELGRQLNAVYVALSRTYRTLANCIQQRLAIEEPVDG
jgi:RNA polymerase sigma-70 factor (ECF subfamily)